MAAPSIRATGMARAPGWRIRPLLACSSALRGEVLKDIDGFDTGLPQTLWDITAGFNFKLAEWLVGRFEYRHDESSQKPFPSSKPLALSMPGARHLRGDRVDLSRDGYHPRDADVYLLTINLVEETSARF